MRSKKIARKPSLATRKISHSPKPKPKPKPQASPEPQALARFYFRFEVGDRVVERETQWSDFLAAAEMHSALDRVSHNELDDAVFDALVTVLQRRRTIAA